MKAKEVLFVKAYLNSLSLLEIIRVLYLINTKLKD